MKDEQPPEPGGSGLPYERTSLAWLRTALAFAVSTVLLARLIAHRSIMLAFLCLTLALPLALAVIGLAWRRHHQVRRDPDQHTHARSPGGILPAGVTAVSILLGCAGIAYVLGD